MKAKKPLSNAQRIAHFLGHDPMNALFVRLAIDHYCIAVMQMDTQKERFGIINPLLLQDIADDWMEYDRTEEERNEAPYAE